jgi:predicted amidohydrolase YtcJ
MTRQPVADVVLRTGAAYPMAPDRQVWRAMAIADGRIVAVSPERSGLDDLGRRRPAGLAHVVGDRLGAT